LTRLAICTIIDKIDNIDWYWPININIDWSIIDLLTTTLLQMADRFVERIDYPSVHDVAIFVGPCEKLTPNWKEDVP
jgi:hypothetical protein